MKVNDIRIAGDDGRPRRVHQSGRAVTELDRADECRMKGAGGIGRHRPCPSVLRSEVHGAGAAKA